MNNKNHETCEVPSGQAPRIWRLRATYEGRERLRILPKGDSLVLGTGQEAGWCIEDPTVSKRHCRIEAGEEGLRLTDLESKNGTYVGAGRIQDAVLVGPCARFSIGRTTIEAEDRARTPIGADLGLVGESEAMQRVREKIRRFAPLRAPVLIIGESGTGKDLVARGLHSESKRDGAYVPLNVAALPDSLLDAELFGHEKGAFTGAVGQRAGLFEAAEGGTLFLDEIAEMSAPGQAKMLRVVEDGRIRALGGQKQKRVEVRLVSATCAPLPERIAQGQFRGDLYHRLSTLVIELPPLRQRRNDIPLLAERYLQKVATELGPKHLTPASTDVLKNAHWPGNVRELFGALYRAAALAPGEELAPGHLQIHAKSSSNKPRLVVQQALELLDVHGNVSAAARAAGVPRSTFRSVIERGKSSVSSSGKSR